MQRALDRKTDGSESDKIKMGEAKIPINASLTILGQDIAFRKDSTHSFQHRLRQAWKAAHANAALLSY